MAAVVTESSQIPSRPFVGDEQQQLHPNGSIASRKPSRQPTLISSGSQDSRNGRLRIQVPDYKRGSTSSKKAFDKFRRLSMAAGKQFVCIIIIYH